MVDAIEILLKDFFTVYFSTITEWLKDVWELNKEKSKKESGFFRKNARIENMQEGNWEATKPKQLTHIIENR